MRHLTAILALTLFAACAPTDLDDDEYPEATDCNDTDPDVHPSAAETCDGRDEDCDGALDEGFDQEAFYLDDDGDGYGDKSHKVSACEAPEGYVDANTDCDDTKGDIHPNPNNGCMPGIDHDCDRRIDEELTTYFVDADGDGYGAESLSSCDTQPPTGTSSIGTDCDDAQGDTWPGAPEVCGDGRDNNCDGETDENIQVWCPDDDGDGFYSCTAPIEACTQPEGHGLKASINPLNQDCDDAQAIVYPGAPDACADDQDTDCDGFECSPLRVFVGNVGDAVLSPVSGYWTSVQCSGDLTGDGKGDLVFGMDYYNQGETPYSGIASVIPGPIQTQTHEWEAGPHLTPPVPYGYFGYTLAMGDHNGDGVADLVGAIDALGPDVDVAGKSTPGSLPPLPHEEDLPPWAYNTTTTSTYLFEGPLGDGWQLEDAVATVTKPPPKNAFAVRMSLEGDLNNDGLGDLVISALTEGSTTDGEAYIYYGPLDGETDAKGDADARITSQSEGAKVGWSLNSQGDLNGDGVQDLVIGAPYDDIGGCQTGAVYVFYGPLLGDRSTADADVTIIGGPVDGQAFGYGLSTGDVNGDGIDDLAASSVPATSGCRPEGGSPPSFVALFLGPLHGSLGIDDAHTRINALNSEATLGYRLTINSDLDGDGLDDLLIPANKNPEDPKSLGSAYLLYGPPAAGVYDVNQSHAQLIGEHPIIIPGERIAEGCDLNGDGQEDVVLSTRSYAGTTPTIPQRLYVLTAGQGRLQR